MRRGVRCADRTCASYGIPNSSSAPAAGSIVGQSESLPMTMPTTGSPFGPDMPIPSVLVLEGEGVVDDTVGQVPGRSDRPGAYLADVGAERGDVAELAAAALPLAVPVELHVGPVRHEVVDPLVERGPVPAVLG